MLPRERVIDVIEFRKPDRIPVYSWVRSNLTEPISEKFGSIEDFEDQYAFDFAHLFGGPTPYPSEDLKALREQSGAIEPLALLDVKLSDPDDEDRYQKIRDAVQHHKEQRGRFVYVQTPGIFECLNGPFGIENHLMYLALYEDDLREVYRRQAEWNRAFAENCLDLGVDMIHISDDWGAQTALMFSPETWWSLIYPFHKITCDAVKSRGGYLSLHSDGNIRQILDGVVGLGFDVVHPWQESAGMDLGEYRSKYADKFVVMGGLDVQTTIGFGDYERLQGEIERVLTMFKGGGLLYCTTHFIQDHCTIEELVFAYDLIHKLVRDA
jgi:uroporphyrinogen decarboxylase